MGGIIIDGILSRLFAERRFIVPWGGAGPHSPIWVKNYSWIKQHVQKHGLKPAAEGAIAGYLSALSIGAGERVEAAKRPPIPGGLRMPHLHVEGEIYLLDEKQWKDFCTEMLREFQAKLTRVNSVSFEQAMELSEAVDTLA